MLATDPEYSAWVNAGAGAGKTKILVDRVLRLILNGSIFSKVLCLTFTNAAANEMKERISGVLQKWSICSNEILANDLRNILHKNPSSEDLEQARKLFQSYFQTQEKVKVYTIHAFCQYILKTFAVEAGLNPNFQIMSEIEQKNILQRIRLNVLNRLDNPSSQSEASAKYFVDNVHDLILQDLFEKTVEDQRKFKALFGKFASCSVYREFLLKECAVDQDLADLFKNLHCILREIKIVNTDSALNLDKKFVEKLSNCLNLDCEVLPEHFETLRDLFLTKEGTPRKKILSNDFAKNNQELVSNISNLQTLITQIDHNQKAEYTVLLSCHLYNLSRYILEEYKNICESANLLDYEDLIVHTKNLLTNSDMKDWILYKLDGGIEHILLDEAQDTSLDQWEIIDALIADFFSGDSGKHKTIFVVGDEKQSIYSFQGSELENFYYYRNKLKLLASQANKKYVDIVLENNYRSTKPILDAVAHFFERLSCDYQNLFVDSSTKLKCIRSGSPGAVVIKFVDYIKNAEEEFWPLKPSNLENTRKHELARSLAAHIKEIISSKIILPSTGKMVSAKDIAILVRKRDEFLKILDNELRVFGIETAGFDRFILKDNLAVLDLISIAKFILQPFDDLNLACLLKSPIFDLDWETMHYILSNRKKGISVWEELQNNLLFQNVHQKLRKFIEISMETSLANFFHTFVDSVGYRAILSNINYESEYAIDELLNLAYKFSQEQNNSLNDFINWFERNTIEVKRDVGATDKIAIMTVHGAKGLQAPIVILAEHSDHKAPNDLFIENDQKVILWNTCKQNSCKYMLQSKEDAELRLVKESIRLFYVAITRAQDKFVFWGINEVSHDDKVQKDNHEQASQGNKIKSWFKLFKEYFNEISDDGVYFHGGFQVLNAESEAHETIDSYQTSNHLLLSDIQQLNNVSNFNKYDIEATYHSPIKPHAGVLYGKIAHKILEDCVLNQDMVSKHPLLFKLPKHQSEKLISDISKILKINDFEKMLKFKVKTEVDIAYKDQFGNIKTGRIDLISISDDEISIVDYKTDEDPKKNVAEYVKQLKFYHDTISIMHPKHLVSCYILWVSTAELMHIKGLR